MIAVAFDHAELRPRRDLQDVGNLQSVGCPGRRHDAPACLSRPGVATAWSKRDERGAEADHSVERAWRQLGGGDGHPFDPKAAARRKPEFSAGDQRDSVRVRRETKLSGRRMHDPLRPENDMELPGGS